MYAYYKGRLPRTGTVSLVLLALNMRRSVVPRVPHRPGTFWSLLEY